MAQNIDALRQRLTHHAGAGYDGQSWNFCQPDRFCPVVHALRIEELDARLRRSDHQLRLLVSEGRA